MGQLREARFALDMLLKERGLNLSKLSARADCEEEFSSSRDGTDCSDYFFVISHRHESLKRTFGRTAAQQVFGFVTGVAGASLCPSSPNLGQGIGQVGSGLGDISSKFGGLRGLEANVNHTWHKSTMQAMAKVGNEKQCARAALDCGALYLMAVIRLYHEQDQHWIGMAYTKDKQQYYLWKSISQRPDSKDLNHQFDWFDWDRTAGTLWFSSGPPS